MVLKEKLEVMLGELGRSLGLDQLGLDQDDSCAMVFDDRIVVDLQFDDKNDTIIFISSLGEIERERKEELYSRMLEANFRWAAIEGLLLSIEEGGGSAVLFNRQPFSGMDRFRFEEVLERFVNAAEYWMNAIEAPAGNAADEVEETIPSNFQGMRV